MASAVGWPMSGSWSVWRASPADIVSFATSVRTGRLTSSPSPLERTSLYFIDCRRNRLSTLHVGAAAICSWDATKKTASGWSRKESIALHSMAWGDVIGDTMSYTIVAKVPLGAFCSALRGSEHVV